MNWYNFALHLGISSTVLDVVKVERQSVTSDCCRESLQRWLRHDRHSGDKGREVGVILEAVRKACGPVAVERIQSSLQGSEAQPSSPTPLLQSTPDLAVLQEHVVPLTAAQWEAVADYLLVSYEKRAVIAASERGHVEVCCRELFNQWLQQLPGTGSLPRTWEKVLDVVGQAVGPEVAKRIRTRLDSKERGEEGSNHHVPVDMHAYHVAIGSIHPGGEQQSVGLGLLHTPHGDCEWECVGHAWPLDTDAPDLLLSLK